MWIFNLQVPITIQVLPSGMRTAAPMNSGDLWGIRVRDGHFPHSRAVENWSRKGCAKLKVEELPWKAVGKITLTSCLARRLSLIFLILTVRYLTIVSCWFSTWSTYSEMFNVTWDLPNHLRQGRLAVPGKARSTSFPWESTNATIVKLLYQP